jgi:hypothetical protein
LIVEAMMAGLVVTVNSSLVWENQDISGSPGVKGVGKSGARGKASCFDDLLTIFFVAWKEVLMVC